MADICAECERLWKEYSAAMHEYLGLNRPANAAGGIRDRGVGPLSVLVRNRNPNPRWRR